MQSKFVFILVSSLLASTHGNVVREPAPVSPNCAPRGAKAVEQKFPQYFFKGKRKIRHFFTSDCEEKISRKHNSYVSCEMVASTDSDAGDVTFTVILNKTCTKVYAAFLVGEE